MAIAIGQRFVRRHDAARTSTSNTTAADIAYDTAVISEGGYGTWGVGETDTTRVDTAGKYLWIGDLGRCNLNSQRAVGTIVPVVDGVIQDPVGMGTHRFLRNSGGAQMGASIGFGILDLAADADVGVRNPGAIGSVDAVGNYATDSSFGGACQLMRLPDGDFLHLERTADQAITQSNINTTRPWVNSSGTWTKLTWPTETSDGGAWHAGGSGDVILPANSKFLIVWTTSCYSTHSVDRMALVTRLSIGGVIVQSGSGYQRDGNSQGPPANGMYLHETGGSTETLFLEATQESEQNTTETPQFADGALQIIELPSGAEWIHVDNGTTDSLTTALETPGTWITTPLSSAFRADGGSNLSLDGANNAVQNDSGGSLGVLAIGWHRWDRDVTGDNSRKTPWTRWNNGGTVLGYGIGSAYSRGDQGTTDCWQGHHCAAALLDMADAADLTIDVDGPSITTNSDMGVYASTNRHFLGVQVLDVSTLVGGANASVTPSVLVASTTAPAVAIQAGVVVSSTVLAATTTAPAVAASGSVAPSPSTLTAPVTTPAPTIQAGAQVTSTVLGGVVTAPAVTIQAGSQVSPAVLVAPVTAPGVAASGSVAPALTALTAPVTTPAVTIQAGAQVTLTVLTAPTTTPAVTPQTGTAVTLTTTVTAVTTPTAIPQAGSQVTPAVLVAAVTTPAVTPQTGNNAQVAPSVLAAPVTVPSPTIQAGVVVSPTVLVAPVTTPPVTPQTGTAVTPSVLVASTTTPAVAIQAGAAVTLSALILPTTTPAVTIQAGVQVTPVTLTAPVTAPAATVQAGAQVTPSTLAATTTLTAVTINTGATVTPAVLVAATVTPAVTVQAGVQVTITTAPIIVTIPGVTAKVLVITWTGGVMTVATIGGTTTTATVGGSTVTATVGGDTRTTTIGGNMTTTTVGGNTTP